MTTAERLMWARRMYILKYNSGSLKERDFYGKECLRLRAKLEKESASRHCENKERAYMAEVKELYPSRAFVLATACTREEALKILNDKLESVGFKKVGADDIMERVVATSHTAQQVRGTKSTSLLLSF